MVKQLFMLFAIAIGGWLILNTLSSSAYSLANMLNNPSQNGWLFLLAVFPVLFSIGVAYFIFSFAKRIEPPSNDLSEALLFGGAKLFGLYLILQGLLRLTIGLGSVLRIDQTATEFVPFIMATLYFGFGFVLSFKTSWLLKRLGVQSDA